MKSINKMKYAWVLLIALAMMWGGSALVAAQDGGEDAAADFVAMGATATLILIIIAVFVWVLGAGHETWGGFMKALAIVLVIVGAAIFFGVFAVSEAPVTTAAARPDWASTMNAANNTTHSTLGVNALTWDVTWDISDASVLPGMDQLTLNVTVYRDDQLSAFYYTNALVDMDSVEDYTQDSGITSSIILYSGGIPQITWTDSGGNPVLDTELPSLPQAETRRETVTCAITLADAGIAGMVDNSLTVSTFNIIIASQTTDSDGNVIAYANPITMPITIVVTTQA